MRSERARVRGLLDLAYWRAGYRGVPPLVVHGWPETQRIWQRNVASLAAAGFEVIVHPTRCRRSCSVVLVTLDPTIGRGRRVFGPVTRGELGAVDEGLRSFLGLQDPETSASR